ncbi:pseudouridylate synthase [Rhodococcus rhodochrous]|uniref:pseudouridine synthase n=1 Tax=Rhodococcus rhodochrous TaxID=1829 RepID=UPI000B1DA7EA|nr:pseudouridine synthase [Rhodococcus rhodochrous]MDJ0400657.1 pseudouridine synthase [Rhodococcus rhodochrous]SNV20370.1 pseudouridylate synthase [Rhodococcus rhodochrous]
MNTPARRDGTPDRRRNNPRSANARNAGGSRSGRAEAPRSGGRTEAPRSGGRTEAPRSSGRTEAPRSGRAGAPRSGERTDSSRSDRRATPGQSAAGRKPAQSAGGRKPAQPAAGRKPHRKGTSTGKPGRPGAKPAAKRAAQRVVPTVSNARPARHQHREAGPAQLPAGEGVRLQKVLAQAGVASRRAAEELIAAGRVEVDGSIVVEQGLRVDPENAVIRVDGVRVVINKDLVHLVLNKPRGWQSTMSDDLGRPCVGDIVSERVAAGQRLFHVGRLDADTEGLLLLTNDGELAHRLMHPSFEVPKTYLATVKGVLARGVGKQLKAGIELEDGPASVDEFSLLEVHEGQSLVRLVLHEGRKHIVRRLLDAVGFPVIRLVRTNIGPVALGDQRPGTLRVLGRNEVGGLYQAVKL